MCAASCIGADLISESDAELCHTDLNQPPTPIPPFVSLPLPVHVAVWLTRLIQKGDFVFFMQRGIRTKIPAQSRHVNMVYLVSPG